MSPLMLTILSLPLRMMETATVMALLRMMVVRSVRMM
jgi:hypothetical protein